MDLPSGDRPSRPYRRRHLAHQRARRRHELLSARGHRVLATRDTTSMAARLPNRHRHDPLETSDSPPSISCQQLTSVSLGRHHARHWPRHAGSKTACSSATLASPFHDHGAAHGLMDIRHHAGHACHLRMDRLATKSQARPLLRPFFAAATVLFALQLSWSRPVWLVTPELRFLQFPWRLSA